MLRPILKSIYRLVEPYLPFRTKEMLQMRYRTRDFCIDIVGSCNLRCPSCPAASGIQVGGEQDKNAGGRMSPETFDQIVKRIANEFPGATVMLFTWTDPLLHPQVHEFVEISHKHGLKSFISTNLNRLHNPELLARAAPDEIRLSLSGFTQPIYEIGHKYGNIDTVKANMQVLSDSLINAAVPQDRVTVYYHKYLHNLHEIDQMKSFSESLGFKFDTNWAFYMPIEKVLNHINGLSAPEDIQFIKDNMALDLQKAVEICKIQSDVPCNLKTRTVIDCHGNVQLCCNIYSQKQFTIAPYLTTSTKELDKRILDHSFCRDCTAYGLHGYSDWYGNPEIRPKIEAMIEQELARH